ncbi:hypothetical protein QCM80_14665 [Bradyrhizobium sp. SSUT112]|uniref:hypothetical protein n=1 Tax=Bradyrhizobium sp. SSUT112 TaxID=3040604 RepID=UPI00244CB5B4|nr:hypothetical protein [Bradyrhizobium sp. SSUT112]MDH2351899.1 hypothetical protein [Bradyrhizobium sp. SSUT112]
MAATLAAIEVIFWSFGTLSMSRGNPYRLYDVSRLREAIAANLETERRGSQAGWPIGNAYVPRPHPPTSPAVCGSAWGGSFTFGDDVADADTWPHRLSVSLGCQVQNYGTDGYGLDQTLIRLRAAPTNQPITIVAIAPPMIMAGGASSWAFVDLDNGRPRARLTKPRFALVANGLTTIPRPAPDVDDILANITSDMPSRDWTAMRFPFSLSVVRAIHRKLRGPRPFNELGPNAETPEGEQLRQIAARIVSEIAATTRERHSHLAVILIPQPTASLDAGEQYADFRRKLEQTQPVPCVIDPTDELRRLTPAAATTDSGHFTAAGNAAIAEAAVRGLHTCGFTS